MQFIKKKWLFLLVSILAVLPLISLIGLLEISFSLGSFPNISFSYPKGIMETELFKEGDLTTLWFPIHLTGEWAIRWLTFSLICTPLHLLTGIKQFQKVRKITGIFAFGYSLLHILLFIAHKNLIAVFEELNFIIGLISFLIMLPLALTSTKKSHKRLKNIWKKIHRWAYLAGILAVLHIVLLEMEWELYAILIMIGFLVRTPIFKTRLLNFHKSKSQNITRKAA